MPRGLDALDVTAVQQNLNIFKQMIREVHGKAAIDRGPFHDLILYYAAVFATRNQQAIADAMRSINLGRLMRDPDMVSAAAADRTLANWLVKRKIGTKAHGPVTILLNSSTGLILPVGFTVVSGDRKFKTETPYTVLRGGIPVHHSDRIMTKHGRNQWSFTVPVVATVAGLAGNLRKGTKLSFDRSISSDIKRVYVAEDFVEGADEETNLQMTKRLGRSICGNVWSNRGTAEALISKLPSCDRVVGISIIGFGDPEMLRDKHSLWPGSSGGRVDVYVKTSGVVLRKEVTVKGLKIGENANGTIWELKIPRSAAPGFFYITAVKRKDGNTCTLVRSVRGVDVAGVADPPGIFNPEEAAYSSFQTCILQVAEMPPTAHATAELLVTLRYMPGITEIQDYLLQHEICSPTSDILVKAPVPCFTSIDIAVQRYPDDGNVPVNAIREAVTKAINNTGFVGQLPASLIYNAAIPFLTGTMAIKTVSMVGKIRCPDGKIDTMQSNTLLTISSDAARMISGRTTAFFQDPADVRLTTVTVD